MDAIEIRRIKLEAGKLVAAALAKHFTELAAMCEKAKSPPDRIDAFLVASQEAKECFTQGYGWMLDMQTDLLGSNRMSPEFDKI